MGNKKGTAMRNRLMGLSVLLIMILTIVPVPAHSTSAFETIQSQVNKVLEVLRNPAENKATKEKKILAIADTMFDPLEMSKRTLANHWRSFSSDQQKEFTSLFGKLLSGVYMDKIMQYTDEKVTFGKETKLSEDSVEVQSEIVTKTNTIPMLYRMIQEKGEWKVYDVSVEGISLVMNYRSQFRDILSKKPPQDLLKMLREKGRK
jgi:phospholipid transport system substrate-binding protein